VSQRDPSHHKTTHPPEDESYASFLRLIDEIGRWLRSGYSVKGVWLACRRSTPAFHGSYQKFWRYCRKHDLSLPRGTPATGSLRPPTETKPAPKAPPAASGSPTVWPRLTGKPREFVPRTED
ncbi:MAG: hypothetical protein WBN01_19430, partial [Polyangiales bacterium]